MKTGLKWLVMLVVAVMMLGVAVSVHAGPVKDTLIIGRKDETSTLDPAKSYEMSGWGMLYQNLYETLVTYQDDNFTQVIPKLAESWEVSPDGKTWTFHLRQGIKFASGNPLNAEAVVFSLSRALKIAAAPSWVLTQFGITEETISSIDDHSVQIVLAQQAAPGLFLACLTCPVASILDPALVQAHEQNGDLGSAWLDDHSAGSGPFVLTERKNGEHFILDANQEYWGAKPAFQKIVLKVVQEPFEQMALLEQGEIDLAWNLQPDQVLSLQNRTDIQVFETLTLGIAYMAMNQGYEPLSKPEVRDAIRYAIDYDAITQSVLGGGAKKIQTFIPEGLLGHNPALPYSQDIAKAKQLLSDAGYPEGFAVELTSLDSSPWLDIATQIKSDLARIDMQVTLKPFPVEQQAQAIMSRDITQAQLFIWDWYLDYPDPDANTKSWAHADSPDDDATIKSLAWWFRYVNLETSKLADQAAQELDIAKREALYRKITDLILDDGPFAILYTPLKQYAVRQDVASQIGKLQFVGFDFPLIKSQP